MWKQNRRRQVWTAVPVASAAVWLVFSSYRPFTVPSAAAISQGRDLFNHQWQAGDDLAAGGDGLGPVFNARSCAECHFQGGVGGAGPNKHNVLSFEVHPTPQSPRVHAGVVHAAAILPELLESRRDVSELFPIVPDGTRVTTGCNVRFEEFDPVQYFEINTPPLFGLGEIANVTEGDIRRNVLSRTVCSIGCELTQKFDTTPIGRARVLPDGRIGKFGWRGQFATIEEFVAAACAVEIGLTNPLRCQDRAGEFRTETTAKLDLDQRQFDALVSFVATLPAPRQVLPDDPDGLKQVHHGEKLFSTVGCADCHTPTLGRAEGLYSDLLLHHVEDERSNRSYVRRTPAVPLPGGHPEPNDWKTPPLWGVADSAPYFHDGRSPTLRDAILRHGGEAKAVTGRFGQLPRSDQDSLIAFLKTLRAPQANQ